MILSGAPPLEISSATNVSAGKECSKKSKYA